MIEIKINVLSGFFPHLVVKRCCWGCVDRLMSRLQSRRPTVCPTLPFQFVKYISEIAHFLSSVSFENKLDDERGIFGIVAGSRVVASAGATEVRHETPPCFLEHIGLR